MSPACDTLLRGYSVLLTVISIYSAIFLLHMLLKFPKEHIGFLLCTLSCHRAGRQAFECPDFRHRLCTGREVKLDIEGLSPLDSQLGRTQVHVAKNLSPIK